MNLIELTRYLASVRSPYFKSLYGSLLHALKNASENREGAAALISFLNTRDRTHQLADTATNARSHLSRNAYFELYRAAGDFIPAFCKQLSLLSDARVSEVAELITEPLKRKGVKQS